MKKPKMTLSCRVDESICNTIDNEAKKLQRTRSELVDKILTYVCNNQKLLTIATIF